MFRRELLPHSMAIASAYVEDIPGLAATTVGGGGGHPRDDTRDGSASTSTHLCTCADDAQRLNCAAE